MIVFYSITVFCTLLFDSSLMMRLIEAFFVFKVFSRLACQIHDIEQNFSLFDCTAAHHFYKDLNFHIDHDFSLCPCEIYYVSADYQPFCAIFKQK